jgi:hypothetical protein
MRGSTRSASSLFRAIKHVAVGNWWILAGGVAQLLVDGPAHDPARLLAALLVLAPPRPLFPLPSAVNSVPYSALSQQTKAERHRSVRVLQILKIEPPLFFTKHAGNSEG